MKNVLVFFGGQSIEHDVSVITGVLTTNSIDKEKFNPIPIFVDLDGKFYTGESLLDLDNYKNLQTEKLKKVALFSGDNSLYLIKKSKIKKLCSVAVAINCMHGERGEDGCLSALMKICNIPLASPDILGAAITMDKAITKQILKEVSVKTLPYIIVGQKEKFNSQELKFSYPIIVKPSTSGSSIGISVANDIDQTIRAISTALKFSSIAIIEPFLKGVTEINCACYKNSQQKTVVSLCEKPISSSDILSFNDKYKNGKREFPAKIPALTSEKIRKTTAEVYEKLNLMGIIRIDFFVKNGEVYLNEINSVPGSLAYYLFTSTTAEFKNILTEVLTCAMQQGASIDAQQKVYKTEILSGVGSKGSKRLKKKI